MRGQWLRASQSIPLNIAEGNGKTAEADRRRYFEIARGSVLECAVIQDVLVVGKGLDEHESRERKIGLNRMAAMLSRLGKRGYSIEEESDGCRIGIDPDFDGDFDPGETHSQGEREPDSHCAPGNHRSSIKPPMSIRQPGTLVAMVRADGMAEGRTRWRAEFPGQPI